METLTLARAALGSLSGAAGEKLARVKGLPEQVWAKDPTAWKKDRAARDAIRNRLGWLGIVEAMRPELDELRRVATALTSEGATHALLLGMGGSSLWPEVLARSIGPQEGGIDLRVLDTTDPQAIRQTEADLDLGKTVLVVASKSGTTIEVLSLLAHFEGKINPSRCIAITDPGSGLAELAKKRGFHHCFENPADIGGRYSALSYFGLVPAALLGINLDRFMAWPEQMTAVCRPNIGAEENPGLQLGAILGAAAEAGRNKLTILASPEIEAFGSWVEQLVAESTGKEGRGILPIDLEPAGEPEAYADDRLFLHLRLSTSGMRLSRKVDALEQAGHPVVTMELVDRYALAGEAYRWQFATAVAGAILGVNPFDEPNVTESKTLTRGQLELFAKCGSLQRAEPVAQESGISAYGTDPGDAQGVCALIGQLLGSAEPGGYVAWLAYLNPSDAVKKELEAMRVTVRDSLRLATSVGFGPRFLHSTGQLHKGGRNQGVFFQLTADDPQDLAIPGKAYGFSVLKQAQALGDLEALSVHDRRAVRLHISGDLLVGLRTIRGHLEASVARLTK